MALECSRFLVLIKGVGCLPDVNGTAAVVVDFVYDSCRTFLC